MATLTGPFSNIEINQIEYGRLSEDQAVDSTSFKVKIPKLMVKTTSNRVIFDRGIFLNSSDCSVQTTNSITTLDYITINKAKTCDLSSVAEDGIIKKDTLVMCVSITNNINDLIIVGAIK